MLLITLLFLSTLQAQPLTITDVQSFNTTIHLKNQDTLPSYIQNAQIAHYRKNPTRKFLLGNDAQTINGHTHRHFPSATNSMKFMFEKDVNYVEIHYRACTLHTNADPTMVSIEGYDGDGKYIGEYRRTISVAASIPSERCKR